MSARIHDEQMPSLSSLGGKKKSLSETFHEFKGEVSKQILSVAYSFGLGYTTLTESLNEHNSNLFREVVIEAQQSQRLDESQIFQVIAKGSLYEVQQELNRIEKEISTKVQKEFAGLKATEIAAKIRKRRHDSAIYATDSAGANIVHCAYLFKHYHIGHYLVKRYPRLASQPYSGNIKPLIEYIEGEKGRPRGDVNLKQKLDTLRKRMYIENDSELEEQMLYTGENVLHITIMRRNYEEVRWLLDFYRDHRHSYPDCLSRLLNTDATGKFFDRSGSFYVGSNPLQFAVCSNSTAIFDLVYSFVSAVEDTTDIADESKTTTTNSIPVGPDVIFSTDKFGNNALHLCVLHGLENMYQHVYNTALQVMRRKVHTLYTDHCAEQPVPTTGFTLKCEIEGTDDFNKGYRLQEKVLHLPPNQEAVREWVQTEARRKVDERLVLALNEDLHSPLTLAAYIIDKKRDTPDQLAMKVRVGSYVYNVCL
jgi:ankyrin repeat protein